MHDDIKAAIEILGQGGIILYPTDTIWGIGCDATCEEAVKKIYAIKQRHDEKSMLILLDEADKLTQYMAEVPEIAWNILDVTDKPITIIYPNAQNLAGNLIADDGSIGIRVVKDEFCYRLIRKFGKPIVSTSANVSGRPWPSNFNKIEESIAKAVDYVVTWRQNDEFRGIPSGIIKLGVNGEIKVIRE
jgi:L-threonylcarbamoyladenylate synthase